MKTKSLKILVTGGSGFIGTATLFRLIKAGHSVIATSTNSNQKIEVGLEAVSWVTWDAMKQPLPPVDFESIDAILHLAMVRDFKNFPNDAKGIFDTNISATYHLLEAAVNAHADRPCRFIFASTGDVLGENNGPAKELAGCYEPDSFYGSCKASAELITKSFSQLLSTAIIRIYHPYGPGGDRFLINRLIHAVANEKEISIEGKDGIFLNPVWIEDLAEGIQLAIESDNFGIFHMAGPDVLSLRELIEIIGNVTGKTPLIHHSDNLAVQRHYADCTEARDKLGFDPHTRLREGIKSISQLKSITL